MKPITLQLNGNRSAFRPGERIDGIVSWNLDASLPAIEVRLFWYTRGKGTDNVEIVRTELFDNPRPSDQRAFSFELPEGPYSFSGTLISLIWGIEALWEGSADATRLEFVLSPTQQEVILGTAETEADASA